MCHGFGFFGWGYGLMEIVGGILHIAVFALVAVASVCAIRALIKNTGKV